MAPLTMREAAERLAEALRAPIRPRHIRDLVACGRLQAEKPTGRWNTPRVTEEEIQRFIEQLRREQAAESAGDRATTAQEEQWARAWDSIPPRSVDYLWRVDWKTLARHSGRPPKAGRPVASAGAGQARLRAELEKLERRREAEDAGTEQESDPPAPGG